MKLITFRWTLERPILIGQETMRFGLTQSVYRNNQVDFSALVHRLKKGGYGPVFTVLFCTYFVLILLYF
jgi:hypothetical protein